MRFVPRDNLIGPDDDVPDANEVNESNHLTSIPREFQKKVVRVYCRNPVKLDLLRHVFEDWKFQGVRPRNTLPFVNFNAPGYDEVDGAEDERSVENDHAGSMLCTQDSDYDTENTETPKKKARHINFDMSPIPVTRKL